MIRSSHVNFFHVNYRDEVGVEVDTDNVPGHALPSFADTADTDACWRRKV